MSDELGDPPVLEEPEQGELVLDGSDEPATPDQVEVGRRTTLRSDQEPYPLDGRFRTTFHTEIPRVSVGFVVQPDYTAPEFDAMHAANKIVVLQNALNVGLHPRAAATFDGASVDERLGVADLTYSVEAVSAGLEAPEDSALAYTPSAALADQGGTTLPDQ